MNSLRNRVQLIGNLGKDPDLMKFESGKVKANISMATTENYRDGDGNLVQDTQWHNVVAWGKNAEIAEKYLIKGKEVAIEGKLVHRTYNDKEGNKKYISEIVVDQILMIGKKAD